MCHMQWFEFRRRLPSKPRPWPQDISVLFHMSRQTFPTFIIFQFFPSLSFYSNSLTTGSFSFEHILSILKGIGYMLKNLRSKNLIDHRTSIFTVHTISVWYVLGNDDGSNGQEWPLTNTSYFELNGFSYLTPLPWYYTYQLIAFIIREYPFPVMIPS